MPTPTTATDDYADLPEWIRPSAKLARLDHNRVTFVTVTKITRTQIITEYKDETYGSVYRFDRVGVEPGWYEKKENPNAPLTYRQRGDHSVKLVRRDEPLVIEIVRDQRIRSAVLTALGVAERSRKRWGNPNADEESLDLNVRALIVLDEVETAITEAKRLIMRAMVDLPTPANSIIGAADHQDLRAMESEGE